MSAIIFDFDGTIADSFDLVLDLFYEITKHPRFTPERIAEFRSTPSLRKAAKAVNITPRQVPLLLIKGRVRMGKRLNEVKPFRGIEPVLRSLHKDGHLLLVISSNSQHNVEAFLNSHGLTGYFDAIYGGVGLLGKASALRRVIRQNKIDHLNCFYVGDEVRDVLAAKHAHVRSIAVGWGYNDVSILRASEPLAVADRPSDLLTIFGSQKKL
jgi:phosphoglycolate phosphatase